MMVVRSDARPRNTLEGTEIAWLKGFVRNPSDFDRFYRGAGLPDRELLTNTPHGGFIPTTFPSIEGPPVEYVIITDNSSIDGQSLGDLVGEFQRLADWKTSKGTPAVVKTVSWIRSNYSGFDDAAKIRSFIKDAYRLWGTDYVLFGGDIHVVPERRMSQLGGHPPGEVYFGGLDNDWDLNNDGLFGPDDAQASDPFWDIWVGRATVDNLQEAATFVTRTLTYARAPGQDFSTMPPSYYDKIMCIAGLTNTFAWQSDANGLFVAESIARLAVGNGMIAQRHYQELLSSDVNCNYHKTYVETQTQPWYWTVGRVLDSLSAGMGIVYHVEHSNPYAYGGATIPTGTNCPARTGGGFGREQIDALLNGAKYSVVFAGGSATNAFDYEAIGEHWLSNPSGGGVAVMGKTRSVTYFISGEVDSLTLRNILVNKMPVGQAMEVATQSVSENVINAVAAYGLLGDPELRAWTDSPDSLDIAVSPSTYTAGEQAITVTITRKVNQAPIQNARICLKQGDRIYGFDLTDAQGKHVFHVNVQPPDTAFVVATATNYTPGRKAIPQNTGPSTKWVVYNGHTALDDSAGVTNNNGIVDAGEVLKLNLEAKNTGSASATSVTGTIRVTGPARFGVTVNGTYQPQKIWLGTADLHPPDLATDSTFAYPDFHGVSFRGRPAKFDTSSVGGLFIWRQGNLWNVVARGNPIVGGAGGVTCRGSIVTKGGWSDTTKSIDGGDFVHFATPDSIYFDMTAGDGTPADQDAFSFVAREINWITLADTTASFGTLASGATAQNRYRLRILRLTPDRHEPVFELTCKDNGGVAVGTSQFVLPVAAPVMSYVRQYPQIDFGPSCGESICELTTAFVRNLGSGRADNVTATLTKTAGSGSVSDATIQFGLVAALSEDAGGADVFKFGTSDTTTIRFKVDLTNTFPDGTTVTWTKTDIDVTHPGRPTGVFVEPYQGRSETITWSAPAASDLAGFNIYRRLSGEGSFPSTPTVSVAFDSTRRFQDVLIVSDTTYVYSVAAMDVSGNESGLSDPFGTRTWIPEHSGWPKLLDAGTPSSPIAVNIDADSTLEIIALGNRVYAWNHDGTPVIGGNSDGLFFEPGAGSPVHVGDTGRFLSSPAVGDLDNDGTPEIVVSAWGDSLWVLTNTGQRKWGAKPRAHWSSPTLGDINGDDSLEVFIVSGTVDSVYAWKHNGAGFLGNPAGRFARLLDGSLNNYATISIGNLDDTTNDLELVYGSHEGNLYAWKSNGDTLWTKDVNPAATNPLSTVAIGNVCTCGNPLELVVSEGDNGDAANNGLYNVNAKTRVMNQIWLTSLIPGLLGNKSHWVHPPSLANIDADSDLEIVLGSSGSGAVPQKQARLLVYNPTDVCSGPCMTVLDSLPGPRDPLLPEGWNYMNAQPLVVNLDQDANHEIVGGSDNFGLYLWQETFPDSCPAEPGWPLLYYGEVDGTSWVGDLDKDGFFELLTRTKDGYVHVFDIQGHYAAADIQWGQFAHDSHHTSLYGYTEGSFHGGGGADSAAPILLHSFPNPFNPSTTIGYATVGRAQVTLTIYSVAGRHIATLVDEFQEPGEHQVAWNARDKDGRQLPSGVYWSRLQVGSSVQTRKLLLLK